ncbi:hypothetical protein Tcan_02239, partial [Toxocara canis]
TVAREPYRCDSYPYTVSEWIDSPTSGGEIEVVCALSYTDRVIRPRSTCIRTKLFDFSRAQTLENKRLELLVRSHPLASNLSRRESGVSLDRQSFKNQSSADSVRFLVKQRDLFRWWSTFLQQRIGVCPSHLFRKIDF